MASKLAQMQARFQKKQMQEKEEKLLKLYENQQQRAFDRIGKNSVGGTPLAAGGGKVRQMFDERRQKAGIDRSYPLEPLKPEKTANLTNASNRNGVRTTNVVRKITTSSTTTLVSRPSNGSLGNGLTSRQIVTQNHNYQSNNNNINEINGKITNYSSLEDDDDDAANNFLRDQRDLVDIMNRNNLQDDINDDEILAHIDQVEAVYNGVGGKLANLGGKLPSEVIPKKAETPPNRPKVGGSVSGGLKSSNTFRKEIKAAPLIKKPTTVKVPASPIRKPSPPSSNTMSKQPPTSARTAPGPIAPVRPTPPASAQGAGNNSAPTAVDRTPNAQRPSAKQTPRGPSAVQRDDLAQCRVCHRRFASDRLQVHEEICAKTAQKKRKSYDSTKHRLMGTDLLQFAAKAAVSSRAASGKSKASTGSKPNNWRQKHSEFIASIRSAKMAQAHVAKGGKLSDLPPPPPSTNPDYVQCPHCGRRFNEGAAERHIPKCASYDYNKPKAGASKGKTR